MEETEQTITRKTYEMIKNMLELNPCLVFNFLNIFGEFAFDCRDNPYETHPPVFNNINVILATKNEDIINKYLMGSKDFTLTQMKMISDSFIGELKNLVEVETDYQNEHQEDYDFLKMIYTMSADQLKEALKYVSEEDRKAFINRVLSLTLLTSKEDAEKMIIDRERYFMCVSVLEHMRIACNIDYDTEFEQYLVQSENQYLIEEYRSFQISDEADEKIWDKIEVSSYDPIWICASAYHSDYQDYVISDSLLDEYVTSADDIYAFIDRLHTFDIDDLYTSKVVKKYLLKNDQKLR